MRERKAFKRAIAFLMSALMAFSVLASDFSMVSAYAVDITEPVVNDSLDDDFTVTEEEIAAINEMGGDFGVMMLGVGRGEDQGKKPEPPKNTLTITVTAEGAAVTGATVSLYYEQVKQQPPHAHNNGNNTVERKYATVTEVGNGVYTADLGPGSHSWQYEISKSGYDIVSGTVGTDKEISVALQKDCKTDIVFKYYSSVDDEVAVGTKNAIKYTFADENFNIISGDFEDITYSGTVMNAEDFAKTFGSVTIPGYTYDKLFFYFEGSSALNSDTYASSFKNTGYQVNASYPSYIGWASPSYPNANDYGDGENSGYMAYDPTGTLRVVFKKNEYKVSFDLSTNDPSATLGENVSSEKTVKYSESYGELPTPTRTGYEFAGWVTEDGTKVTKDSKYELTSNQTLYADWSVSTTNVAYHSNHYGEKSGDDVVKTETAVVGSAIDFTPAIKAAGARYKYAFKGWSATRLDPDRTNPDEDILGT